MDKIKKDAPQRTGKGFDDESGISIPVFLGVLALIALPVLFPLAWFILRDKKVTK